MHQPRRLRLTASILLCFVLQAHGADKYTDENRPYEFGFKIDGQQHRHESKDKDGIIMGEFGFITADDVYHVTVYATDKEGRFKILSMKNIHLKSSPASNLGAPTSARQGHALALPPASVQSLAPHEPQKPGGVPKPANLGTFTPQAVPVQQAAFAPPTGKPASSKKPVSIEPPGRSCSSCSLPTTTTRAPPPAYNQEVGKNNYNSPTEFGSPGSIPQNQQALLPSSPGQQNNAQGGPSGPSYRSQGSQPASPPSPVIQPNIAQGGPSGPSYSSQGNEPASPPSPAIQPNIAQGRPSGPSYSSQGSEPASQPSPAIQPNIAQGRPSGPSYSSQGSEPASPPSPAIQPNIVQGGPSGLLYNPQAGQPAFSPSSPKEPSSSQAGSSGSLYSPQRGQENYPSSQQNIPQQGLVAPDRVSSIAPQPSQIAQNYPGSPSYSQGPSAPNVPNYEQPKATSFSSAGPTQGETGKQPGLSQTNSGTHNRLFGGNNNPYSGAGGSDNSVPNAGNTEQDNAQPAGLARPNAPPIVQSSNPQGGVGERTAKQFTGPSADQQFFTTTGPKGSQGPGAALRRQRGPAKPTLFSAQMQIVDKNTDIHALGPDEQKGLPPGLSHDDISQLLYTFNYTLGFHGHFEEGFTNGVKKGYYFVTGRNGVRTRIDYVADDTGFHPKVSQEILDLLSEDVPKPETEKDEKYGLKGYEFKWLYYPVESKRR